jgi:DNA topoisomerase-3
LRNLGQAIWEQAPDMLQRGEMSPDEFVAKQSAWISKQMQRFAGLRLSISGLASPAAAASKPVGREGEG